MTNELLIAVEAAMAGDWHAAHQIAQKYHDSSANWLHGVLHKIEGDEWNSKYWYAKTKGVHYQTFSDADAELRAIQASLQMNKD